MRLIEIVQYENKLDSLFTSVSNIDDFEMQAHWARYLCVLSSGYIEKSVRSIYSKYVYDRSNPHISSFVGKKLNGFQNAKVDKVIDLAKLFNDDWASELSNETSGVIKDSVNSIVANRHCIAHGQDTNITIARVKD